MEIAEMIKGLCLLEGGENRCTNVQLCRKINRRATIEFITKLAILPNCNYM